MRFVLVALVALFLGGSVAQATTPANPRVDAVASQIAQQPITVLCYARGEVGDPWKDFSAWGYVWIGSTEENMAAEVCDGVRGIVDNDSSVPLWKQGVGALVLAHESFHLRLNLGKSAENEAKTECRAIRHARATMRLLGASEEKAEILMAYALALHWRLVTRHPQYYLKSCKVPNWY